METQKWLFPRGVRWIIETDGITFTLVGTAEQMHNGHIIEKKIDKPHTYTKREFKDIVVGTCGALVYEFKF